jgi:hypothetical protein
MTYNDLEVSERITKIKILADQLNYQMREGKEVKLFELLSLIHHHSREAGWRMNKVKFEKDNAK